jgi:DNA gyrase subunit A
MGAQLRADDVVDHFFVTTTHHWLLFFTNQGRVYRAKTYELQEGGRDAKGQHVANLLELQPDEQIAEILDIRDYEVAKYLVLATREGLVKKTELTAYDTNRSRGVIAINLREGDELVSAMLADEDDEILLVSRKGMSLRFEATDDALRPMGRATSGVKGMSFRGDDSLLEASVVASSDAVAAEIADENGGDETSGQRFSPTDTYVFTVTDGGYAKRTRIEEYRKQQRGGLGIKVAKLSDERGELAGALIASSGDEVLVVLASGKVVRSDVAEVPAKGRDTMGVVFAKFASDDRIIAVAKNTERNLVEEVAESEGATDPDAGIAAEEE